MSQGFARPPSGAPSFQPPQPFPSAPSSVPSAPPPFLTAPPHGLPPAPPFPSVAVGPPQQGWSPAMGTGAPSGPAAGPPARPAVIALACTMAVVASLQWVCALSLAWVTATTTTGTFSELGDNGAIFHILNRFNYRLLDGLAIPLFGFPLASLVTGFLILAPRPWTRMLHTLVGLVALAWAAWWLRENLLWWFSAAWYVVVACLVLWTPGATAWYRWRPPGRDARPPV